MFDHRPTPLPQAERLTAGRQLRLIVAAVLSLLTILAFVMFIRWLATPTPIRAVQLPPDTFRPTGEELAQLKIEPVTLGADPGVVDATGTISVDEDHSTPIVLPYSGQVGEVFVQAGQSVFRGQPLLRISSSDFVDARNGLFAAAAQRATAAAQLNTAEQNELRQGAIYQTAGGALKDYRQAQNDLISSQSAMRTADAALGAARDKLTLLGKTPDEVRRLESAGEVAGIYSETTYHAPATGVIATRDVSPGQYLSAGGDKPIMTIADLRHVWLVAQIAETDSANVHLGDPVDVTTPAYPGRVFHAVIDNIGAALDETTHRLPVRATVANPDEALKPQMFASFVIQRHLGDQSVLVPANAVIHEGDTARVWVLRSDGLLHAQTVTVADSANGFEKISSGVNPGDRVVTAGAIFVNEAGLGA